MAVLIKFLIQTTEILKSTANLIAFHNSCSLNILILQRVPSPLRMAMSSYFHRRRALMPPYVFNCFHSSLIHHLDGSSSLRLPRAYNNKTANVISLLLQHARSVHQELYTSECKVNIRNDNLSFINGRIIIYANTFYGVSERIKLTNFFLMDF